MYEFDYTQRFMRDVKRLKRKHFVMGRLNEVLDVPERYDFQTLVPRSGDCAFARDGVLFGLIGSKFELPSPLRAAGGG